MKALNAHIAFIIVLTAINPVFSQDSKLNEYSSVRYDHTFTYGAFVHSNGWGINTQYMLNRTVKKNFIFSLDFMTLKHPKETKVLNPVYTDARPYVFGKQNSAFVAHTGFGNQFIIADKENPLGVRVNFDFLVGPSFALLKPNYLEIRYIDPITNREVFEQEVYDPENPIHTYQSNIKGSAGFTQGLSELSPMFGGFAKLSFCFEWDDYETEFKSIEAGVIIDAYPEALPIFAMIENKSVFTNIFFKFNIGKRW